MRILAIDPGEKKIGLAISDPVGIAARPLTTLEHTARMEDAARIVGVALEHDAQKIVVGMALEASGQIGPAARHAERLVAALRELTLLPVVLYDESLSTQIAHDAMLASGRRQHARREKIHAASAAAILQSYLDAHSSE